MVRQPAERCLNRNAARLLKYPLHQAFRNLQHIVYTGEGHFDIQLRELQLPVCTGIFVAETARNLKIPVYAAHHQNLLELLRRLRERVEFTGIVPTRHEDIARTLRSAIHQDRCLDFKEAVLVHIVACSECRFVPHRQRRLHCRTAQIDEPILHPNVFRDFHVVFHRERRRFRRIQNAQRIHGELNLTRGQFRINSALIDV